MGNPIKVPSVGESVTEAVLAQWFKQDGDRVKKDEPLFLIETDKITLEVVAEADGVLHIQTAEGQTVDIGAVVGTLETVPKEKEESVPAEKPSGGTGKKDSKKPEPPAKAPPEPKAPEPAPEPEKPARPESPPPRGEATAHAPSVRRLLAEHRLDAEKIRGTGPGGRITKGDVLLHLEQTPAPETKPPEPPASDPKRSPGDQPIERKPMSPIRRRIAARMLEAKQNMAMLTTFNEIDMSRVQALRSEYKAAFRERYGVSLGIMSFFIKACVNALKAFPQINAFIEGSDIVYHRYYHIGVAVGAERGLVVPVIRHADRLSFAQMESAIAEFVEKIRENRLELAEIEGGTFTITNGGVFGSLLSTPILNAPQSGILGMHKIEDRPVVVDGQIVIRPMMYVALSYDHRIVDGREAVSFLKQIKTCIESPERMMVEI